MCDEYGVSRATVREAFRELDRAGLIRTIAGRGTFVTRPPSALNVKVSLAGFSVDLRREGATPSRRLLDAGLVVAPPPEIARTLGMAPGDEMVRIERLRLVNNIPLGIHTVYLNHRLCPGILHHNLAEESLLRLLQDKYGLTIARADEEIYAALATEREAALLNLPRPGAVLRIERTDYEENGRAVEFSQTTYCGDWYRVSMKVETREHDRRRRSDGVAPRGSSASLGRQRLPQRRTTSGGYRQNMAGPKTHRWKRIFRDDGKTVIFAMDHAGMFGMQEGLEKPGQVISKVRAGGADAILTTYGISTRFAEEIGDMGLVVRVDGGNSNLAKERSPMSLVFDVPSALRIGADAVGTMGWPGSRFETEMLPYLCELVRQGAEWNVPVMAEMLPAGFENPKEWWTPENIGHACRIGAELGVDFIKTNYTGDPRASGASANRCTSPSSSWAAASPRTRATCSRAFTRPCRPAPAAWPWAATSTSPASPDKVTAAIAAIVHENATVDEAMKRLL